MVDVSTPNHQDKQRLQRLGLDLTEHGDANSIEVVLYGEQDAQKLRNAKFQLHGAHRRPRQAGAGQPARRPALPACAQAGGSELPSGSTAYRHLADYELELKLLASKYPKLVRPLTLPHRTHLGRDVVGIEIATDPYNLRDGKPIFANIGTHHAREWPAAEHTLEWALRPAHQLRRAAAHDAPGEGHAQHRDPGREPGRVQHLARGA